MNDWQSTWLGRRSLPRDLSGFEIEALFTFSEGERRVIEARRSPWLKLALALQIGFLRMGGRPFARSGAYRAADAVATLGESVRSGRAGSGFAAHDVSTRQHAV